MENVEHPGNINNASSHPATLHNSIWIIYRCASDRMTNDLDLIQSIMSISQSVIFTANGSTSYVTRENPVTLSNKLTLDTVIVASSFE